MEELEKYSRVYAEIDLDAVLSNLDHMKKNISSKTKMMAVIKTDGYGHGAIPIAKELENVDYVFGYATATVEEALTLRDAGILKPILILGYTFPYCYKSLVDEEIRPALFRLDAAKQLNEEAKKQGKVLKVHIKVDTGMSRVGIIPDETGLAFVREVMKLKNLEIEGVFTHFSKADEADKTTENYQFSIFKSFVDRITLELGLKIPIVHCANSATIVDQPEYGLDMVRAGVTMYGMWPSNQVKKENMLLLPALSLKSHIAYLKKVPVGTQISYNGIYTTDKETMIATIPVGYGDGYPRSLSNKGYVLIHGQKAKICGKVCMDQFMVDVTDIADVAEGDEVTLIGKDGQSAITMEEVGDLSGRFNYELACDFSKRIPRIYRKNGKLTV